MKKKYLFIYGQINCGGAERVLIDILNNFDYSSNEVDLLQIIGGGDLCNEIPEDVNILTAWNSYSLNYKFANKLSIKFSNNFLFKRKLQKILCNKKYDVAISFLEGMPLKIHSLVTSVAKRNYSWVHCDIYTNPYEKELFRKNDDLCAYNKMDSVICVSSDTKNAFIKRFPNCQSNVNVIYNPLDFTKIKKLSTEYLVNNTDYTIVVVGRLVSQKRIDRVIRIAKKIKEENLPITIQIIGDGVLKSKLSDYAKSLNIDKHIQFLGYLKNPYPYIKAANLLLSTSEYEGFSLVICEAMCLDIPVVSTKTCGPIEILDNNKYGILCDQNDDSIYCAIKLLYSDKELSQKYSKGGYDRVKMFSIENCMNKIYKL